MTAAAGETYRTYRSRTPFLLPAPHWLSTVISMPMRLVLRRPWPENGRQVAAAIAVYASVLIVLSVPFAVFDWPPRIGWWGFPYNVWPLG